MQRTFYTFFLCLFFFFSYSQDLPSQLIGKWQLLRSDFVGEVPQASVTWKPQATTEKEYWWFFATNRFNTSDEDKPFTSKSSAFELKQSLLTMQMDGQTTQHVIEKISADSLQLLQVEYFMSSSPPKDENVIHWRYTFVRQPVEAMPEPDPKPIAEDPNEEKHKIIEKMPEFPGGINGLMRYLGKNTRYPKAALRKGVKGSVWVQFTVSETGEVVNGFILRSPRTDFALEVVRVCQEMPRWSPGTQNGKPVPVKYVMPIKFSF